MVAALGVDRYAAAVVRHHKFDLIILLRDGNFDFAGLRMLKGITQRFAGDL